MSEYLNVLGIKIKNSNYNELILKLKKILNSHTRYSLLNVNSYIILLSTKNRRLKEYLNDFSDLYGDGVGVYLASKMLYPNNPLRQRITGTDLYYLILDLANERKSSIFFFGGSVNAAKRIRNFIANQYPCICITGVTSRRLTFDDTLFNEINASNSDILFLGLGSPHQEEFVSLYRKFLDVPLLIAVGSGLEFISGNYKRAPLVLRKIGLEWFYRLLKEPKRLWKTYLIGIPVFIFKVLCFKVRLLLNKS